MKTTSLHRTSIPLPTAMSKKAPGFLRYYQTQMLRPSTTNRPFTTSARIPNTYRRILICLATSLCMCQPLHLSSCVILQFSSRICLSHQPTRKLIVRPRKHHHRQASSTNPKQKPVIPRCLQSILRTATYSTHSQHPQRMTSGQNRSHP